MNDADLRKGLPPLSPEARKHLEAFMSVVDGLNEQTHAVRATIERVCGDLGRAASVFRDVRLIGGGGRELLRRRKKASKWLEELPPDSMRQLRQLAMVAGYKPEELTDRSLGEIFEWCEQLESLCRVMLANEDFAAARNGGPGEKARRRGRSEGDLETVDTARIRAIGLCLQKHPDALQKDLAKAAGVDPRTLRRKAWFAKLLGQHQERMRAEGLERQRADVLEWKQGMREVGRRPKRTRKTR